MKSIESALRERVRRDEGEVGSRTPSSLWEHLQRVARFAEMLGRSEGLEPNVCRLVGLFHDAGKFAAGGNRVDDRAEEERSVEVLRELAGEVAEVDAVAGAIQQLYRGDPEPTPLARVLFDADNLDKLGPLGIANYFVKQGLRGFGISARSLFRLTIELTYARVAPEVMMTAAGKRLAERRGAQTTRFARDLLDAMREDGVADLRVVEVPFSGIVLEIVEPPKCRCGAKIERKLWEVPGMKCSEIHLEHRCADCGNTQKLRFCRPRLPSGQ